MRDLPTTRGTAVRVFFRHASPIILLGLLAVTLGVRIFLGGWSWWDLLPAVALVLVWPVYEWFLHIFTLHFRPLKIGRLTLDLPVAKIHRRHHADPWDLPIVFIPLHVIPLTAIPLGLAAWFLAPTPTLGLSALAAYLLLSLHYEWCHYLAHIDWCPDIEYYRRRVRKHRLHHFHHERLWWGVSTGLGDALLGTDPDPKDVEHSPTTHDLLGAPHMFRRGD